MQLDSYKEQDQEKQKMITKLAVIKSIWESGAVPNNLPELQQNWVREMFHFSMDLIGAKEQFQDTYTEPFQEQPPKGLYKASIEDIVNDDAIEPVEPRGGYKYPPFVKKEGCISEAQSKRLFAIAKSKSVPSKMVNAYINKLGYSDTSNIPWKKYEGIVKWVEWQDGDEVPF